MTTNSSPEAVSGGKDDGLRARLDRPIVKVSAVLGVLVLVSAVGADAVGFPEVGGLILAFGITIGILSVLLIYLPVMALDVLD